MEGRGSSTGASYVRLVTRSDVVWAALALVLFTPLTVVSEDKDELPRFIEDVPNITVTVGRDALLPCTVEQLKGYKVAWVQVDTQTILTIHKQVITRNPRIALLHNDHRSWHLELKNVREKDRGWYMCQVNTDPMRSKQGYVDVVVPPDIIDRESSGDLTIREGQDVTLTCRAKGHPTPSIVWRREDNQDIVLDSDKADSGGTDTAHTVKSVEGETLVMKRVSRLQMGSYLCIASNGIPPSISKRTQLRVQFPPVAWVPQQLEGAYIGQELTIECHTEAFPKSINFWTNTNGDMVVSDERYEPIVTETSYKVYMKLRIRRVEKKDVGTFRCIAKNSLGETDGAIRIYEIEPPKSHSNGVFEMVEADGGSGEGSTPVPQNHLNKGPGHHTNPQRGLQQPSFGLSFGQSSAARPASPTPRLTLTASFLTAALLPLWLSCFLAAPLCW
ncbi:hypothetical protein O3P69_020649 [Scylla paramamosain]|uniref:Ig-like domain-containing protein n=1 Tax=Scylla paramamosain TaxID=85552 RepID=A0AAW0TM54_SCYPA